MENLPNIRPSDTLESYAANLKTKLEMAAILLKSGLVPKHFTTPEAILSAILYGQELGFSPMQSVQSIIIIQGKPTVESAGFQALAIQHGGRFEDIEHTDKICWLRLHRGSESREFKFSIEDARQMGLADKDNWRKMPKDMLYARCASRAVRRMFPDIVKGFKGREEMEDAQVMATASVVAEPQLELDVQPADEIPAPPPYLYDVKQIAEKNRQAAVNYAKISGAIYDERAQLITSPKRLTRLDSYVLIDMGA